MTHNNPLHILGIPGSLRKKSYNRALLKAAQEVAPEGMTIDIFDLHDIPFFNADVEAQGIPEPVARFHEAIRAADALLIATPEYNYSIPGGLKNAIDWASRKGLGKSPPINDKVAGIMGAGGRYGTVLAQMHLRQILLHNNVQVLTKPNLMLPSAWKFFDQDGRLKDDATRTRVQKLIYALESNLKMGR